MYIKNKNSDNIIYILSHTFAWSKKHIRGSIEERYIIYADLAILMRKSFKLSWYATRDRTYCQISSSEAVCRSLTILRLLRDMIRSLFAKGYRIYLISYPYCLDGDLVLKLIVPFLLTTIGVIKVFKRNLLTVIDVIDPPIETAISDNVKTLPLLKYVFLRILDILFHKMSSINIVLTLSYKKYFSMMYDVKSSKYKVVPPPSLCRWINYNPIRTKDSLRILYSGVCKKERNIDLVIDAIKELRSEGYNISLLITSPLIEMELPGDIEAINYPWRDYVEKALMQADICIIPYPPNKIHYMYTLVAKCFDYLCAGKPILSTPLGETARIIIKHKCGLIFKDKEELKEIIRYLYRRREKIEEMSKNAKKASKQYCDHILAKKMALIVLNKIKKNIQECRKIFL
ncbi:MAG: glycosyltransferase [Zestosphaera sp.]